MIRIVYWYVFAVITLIFSAAAVTGFIKEGRKFSCRLGKFFLLYFTALVLVRIVYFPMNTVNGRIGFLKFNYRKILPFKLNLVPFVYMFEIYDGWFINIVGNILLFVPVGIIWPVCFKKLDSVKKTVLAGGGLSLFIELSQLLLYERNTDIDDLILNTAGAALGALIYFSIKKRKEMKLQKTIQWK